MAINSAWESWTELQNNLSSDIHDSVKLANQKSKWHPPPDGFLKCNTDACFDDHRRICAIGVILRDEHGKALSGSAKILPAASPLHAEAVAMKEAHQLITNLGIKNIIFESDNLDLIYNCKGTEKHWQISPVIHEIENLRKQADSVIYSWCKREANEVADEIARLCRSYSPPRFWPWLPPQSLLQKLEKDKGSVIDHV